MRSQASKKREAAVFGGGCFLPHCAVQGIRQCTTARQSDTERQRSPDSNSECRERLWKKIVPFTHARILLHHYIWRRWTRSLM